MSYNFQNPCYNCKKKEQCKDQDKIQEAIYGIHRDDETHKGSGTVVLMCTKVDAKS